MSSGDIPANAAGQQLLLDNITFGIELECIGLTPEFQVPAREYIRRKLPRSINLPCSKPGCPTKSHNWRLPINYSTDNQGYDLWKPKGDSTVTLNSIEEGRVDVSKTLSEDIELVSRVLNFGKPTPDPFGQRYPCTNEEYTWDWRLEVTEILKLLSKTFRRCGYRLVTNESAGFHIHIGMGKAPAPANTAYGMLSAFTAFERIFDQITPVSRIFSYSGEVPTPKIEIEGLSEEYNNSSWARSMSNYMFLKLQISIANALKGDADILSEASSDAIANALRDCNVPAWLRMIRSQRRVPIVEFLDRWWPQSHLKNSARRESAVNLTNLDPAYDSHRDISKKTIEVRMHHSSLYAAEVMSWIDLMCNLALWMSRIDIYQDDYLVDIWADPNATIVDVARLVGASQKTIDFYTDRLTPDWAERRHRLLISVDRNPHDELNPLTIAVEDRRLEDFSPSNVDKRIRSKLINGLYGQYPLSFLTAQLPALNLTATTSEDLCIDTCDWDKWIQTATQGYKSAAGLIPVPGASDDLFFRDRGRGPLKVLNGSISGSSSSSTSSDDSDDTDKQPSVQEPTANVEQNTPDVFDELIKSNPKRKRRGLRTLNCEKNRAAPFTASNTDSLNNPSNTAKSDTNVEQNPNGVNLSDSANPLNDTNDASSSSPGSDDSIPFRAKNDSERTFLSSHGP